MARPLHTPRINNNDDAVEVVAFHVSPGDEVKRGDLVAVVETDKSALEVESDQDGYVLDIRYAVNDHAKVGSILMWIGDGPDEPIPETPGKVEPEALAGQRGRPTARASALLRRYGFTAEQVPAGSDRLNAADVESYAARKGLASPGTQASSQQDRAPEVPGELLDLSATEQGMLNTVSWHRDMAASAYLEIKYDSGPWNQVAADFAAHHGLMMSPMLPLMAYRLVQLVAERPKVNSTIVINQRYQYSLVNLGFTVQAGDTLYLTVIRDAGSMDVQQFIRRLGETQRHAMGHKLTPAENQGATVAFSSMSRWGVTRHMPILPPQTSIIIAHAAPTADGETVLGATYDHRVLSGYDVVKLLTDLAKPPEPMYD